MAPTIALKCRLKARPATAADPSGSVMRVGTSSTSPASRGDWCWGLGPPPAFPSAKMTPPAKTLSSSTSSPVRAVSLFGTKRGVSPVFLPKAAAQQVRKEEKEEGVDDEAEGVQLLLGIATIVSKEVADSGSKDFFNDDDDDGSSDSHQHVRIMTPPPPTGGATRVGLLDSPPPAADDMFAWSRARSVSIDSPQHGSHTMHAVFGKQQQQGNNKVGRPLSMPMFNCPLPTTITPVDRPSKRSLRTVTAGRKGGHNQLKFIPHKAKKEQVKFPKLPQLLPVCTVEEYTKKAYQNAENNGITITTIGRKKFSWKNYPELEAFLIANREEYLRHSALNYTVQQKHYNNRLTERLLELASEHGYVFDGTEFNFVTVRDRIRCFYKSYVQSSKKRGIVLGYAARKAGILTTADLQKSARQESTIFTPMEL